MGRAGLTSERGRETRAFTATCPLAPALPRRAPCSGLRGERSAWRSSRSSPSAAPVVHSWSAKTSRPAISGPWSSPSPRTPSSPTCSRAAQPVRRRSCASEGGLRRRASRGQMADRRPIFRRRRLTRRGSGRWRGKSRWTLPPLHSPARSAPIRPAVPCKRPFTGSSKTRWPWPSGPCESRERFPTRSSSRRPGCTVDFQEYGTPPVQKHGTPGARPSRDRFTARPAPAPLCTAGPPERAS
jgi:hypothetical protein